MTIPCPCCGQDVDSYPVEKLAAVVSPVMGEVVEALMSKPGEYVSVNSIASYVWRRDPHGGPENPNLSIANAIAYNRRRISAMGWEIKGRRGAHGGYILKSVA